MQIHYPSNGIRIERLNLVAEGSERLVFLSDEFPHFVFKLLKGIQERRLKNDLKGFLLRAYPKLNSFFVKRECEALINSTFRHSLEWRDSPVPTFSGFINSDAGPLQVIEKITLNGLQPGPTLLQLLSSGEVDQEKLSALNVFSRRLLAFGIPTNDVRAANIVYGRSCGGQLKFCLVDGIGDIHLVPIRTYSQSARKNHLAKAFSNIAPHHLKFDKRDFEFNFL